MTAAIDLLTLMAELNGEQAPARVDLDDAVEVVPVRAHTRRVKPIARALRSVPAPAPETPAFLPTKAQRVAARQRDYERLEPIALELARKVGAAGFTADNLRRAAVSSGIITGDEAKGKNADQQRALSWFGPFLTSLVRRGRIAPLTYPDGVKVKRLSDRPEAHANAHVVYVLPEFSRRSS